MAKLYLYYGAMGSSKTADALMTKFNYEEKEQKALLVKPGIENRDGQRTIKSRIGLSGECILLEELETIDVTSYDVIIVDEAQFATENQINMLANIVDTKDIPVICYAIRTDFQGHLFPGTKRLLELADTIVEKKTMCWCGKKATFNARYNENGIIRKGDLVQMGGNDSYVSLCRKHFMQGLLSNPKLSESNKT